MFVSFVLIDCELLLIGLLLESCALVFMFVVFVLGGILAVFISLVCCFLLVVMSLLLSI